MRCLVIVIISIFFLINNANARSKMKKFENPAMQFVGVWRVDSHDFREFIRVPVDLDEQLQESAASFPVGQSLKIERHGEVVMPGTFNTDTMEFEGPVGEELSIKFLTPLNKRLCTGYWDFVCSGGKSEQVKNFMITDIRKWDADDIRSAKLWRGVKHVDYSWVSLNKSHSFTAWVTREGNIILPIFLKGEGKEGRNFGFMGVILKRVDK